MTIIHLRRTLIFAATLALGICAAASQADSPESGARFQNFKIGDYSATALYDGSLREPNDGKSFVIDHSPTEVGAVLTAGGAPTDQIGFSLQPLLVHARDRVLLFDTGAGVNFGPIAGKLPQSLAAAGEKPDSVTDIFISHAHGDHVGGLITSSGMLAFPNATIHLSAPEWQWLSSMSAEEGKKIGLQNLAVLVAAIRPKVVPFEPGADLLPGMVKAVDIKGHTPGHSGYLIGSGTDTILFIGDTMHSSLISVGKPAWRITFDTDKKVGAASRAALVAHAAASGERLYAGHFPFPGIGKIARTRNGYVWMPEF